MKQLPNHKRSDSDAQDDDIFPVRPNAGIVDALDRLVDESPVGRIMAELRRRSPRPTLGDRGGGLGSATGSDYRVVVGGNGSPEREQKSKGGPHAR